MTPIFVFSMGDGWSFSFKPVLNLTDKEILHSLLRYFIQKSKNILGLFRFVGIGKTFVSESESGKLYYFNDLTSLKTSMNHRLSIF